MVHIKDNTSKLEEAMTNMLLTQSTLQTLIVQQAEKSTKNEEIFLRNEEKFLKNEEKFLKMEKKLQENEEKFEKKLEERFQMIITLINNLPETIKERIGFT